MKIGRYEILDEVGQGAMGTVYRARDPLIERAVAIKTLPIEQLRSRRALMRSRDFCARRRVQDDCHIPIS